MQAGVYATRLVSVQAARLVQGLFQYRPLTVCSRVSVLFCGRQSEYLPCPALPCPLMQVTLVLTVSLRRWRWSRRHSSRWVSGHGYRQVAVPD
jgi:hypothetical protein